MAKFFKNKEEKKVEEPVVEQGTNVIGDTETLSAVAPVQTRVTVVSPKTFDEYADYLKLLHDSKQDGYGTSPIDELSVSAWKYQIQIKATRALRSTNEGKLKEELLDTATYCLLLLEKLSKGE
jgi:hypothetical protein